MEMMRNKAIIIFLAFILVVVATENDPIVSIDQGRILGKISTSARGKEFYKFQNVPFAKPPINELRFKDPEPAEGWDGIRDGTVESPICIQPFSFGLVVNRTFHIIGKEDCLYLNINTPKYDSSAKLPVMVWIHGGAYFAGFGETMNPKYFLNEDVILVTINYRLGILGFASTEDDVVSGNYGLKDLVLALKWIQNNIEKFGGDPSMVTIFGESAGGALTHHLVLSPEAKGLFSRAIMQSGSAANAFGWTEGHREHFINLASAVGCTIASGLQSYRSQKLLDCVRKIDEVTLTTVLKDNFYYVIAPMVFIPRIDGKYIVDKPWNIIKTNNYESVDIMHGYTSEDGGYYVLCSDNDKWSISYDKDPEYVQMIALFTQYLENGGELAKKAYTHYVKGDVLNPAEQPTSYEKVTTHRSFVIGHELTAILHADHQVEKRKSHYYYEYSYPSQRSFTSVFKKPYAENWTVHTDDALMMGYLEHFPYFSPKSEEDQEMTDTLIKLWTNFAKYGNPTPDDSLGFKWDQFTKETPNHLLIDKRSFMEEDKNEEMRNFWKNLLDLPL